MINGGGGQVTWWLHVMNVQSCEMTVLMQKSLIHFRFGQFIELNITFVLYNVPLIYRLRSSHVAYIFSF